MAVLSWLLHLTSSKCFHSWGLSFFVWKVEGVLTVSELGELSEGARRSRKCPTNARNHDWDLQVEMQPHKPGVEGSGKTRGQHQSFLCPPRLNPDSCASSAYTSDNDGLSYEQTGTIWTPLCKSPLDYPSEASTHPRSATRARAPTSTMATGWVWSSGRKPAFSLKA